MAAGGGLRVTHAGPHAWEPDEAPTYRCCLEDRHGDPCPAIDYRRLRSIRDAAIIEADPEDVASWEAHRERYAEDALARSEGRTWAGREPDRTPAVDEYLAGAREEDKEMPTLDLFAPAAAPEPRPHPAAWSLPLLDALREIVPPGIVVDPFGGTGKLALLGQRWRVLCGDLEPEWVGQAWRYGAKGLRWDATALPLASGSVPAVVTSPAYGNRLADAYAYDPCDAGRRSDGTRRSYRGFLGRPLSEGSGAGLQWGDAYRALHERALREFVRVLAPGGMLVVNMKDHVRGGRLQRVCDWWAEALRTAGARVTCRKNIVLAGDQNLARARAQGRLVIDHEELIVAERP